MARIEAENGYLKIDLAPGETIAKAQDDAGNTEITFDSAKDAGTLIAQKIVYLLINEEP